MSLRDLKVKDTYKGVLILNANNTNVDTTIQLIKDGDATDTALGVSTRDVQISTPGGDTFTMPTSAAVSGQVLVFNGTDQALRWVTPVQNVSDLNNDLGFITQTSADSRFTTSAQVNAIVAQASLSADIDLSQFITQASAEASYGFSALSQFSNDVGFITETSAVLILNEMSSAAGYITEASADSTYVTQGDLSALSQFSNDVGFITETSAVLILNEMSSAAGYITEASADSTYVTQGDLSALSQFSNDVGFITKGSADSAYLPVGTPTGVSYTSVIEYNSSVVLSADVVGAVVFASSNAILTIAQDSDWNPGDTFTIIAETSGATIAAAAGISLVNNPGNLDTPFKEVLVIAKTGTQFVFVNV